MRINDSSSATTINTINVWELLTGFASVLLDAWTFASDALTGNAGTSGEYILFYTATLVSAEAANKDFECSLFVDGAVVAESRNQACLRPNECAVMSGVVCLDYTSGTTVEFKVRNITDDTNVTVKHASVVLHRVG